jgi:transcriptional regulator with XRE-family HTH domain
MLSSVATIGVNIKRVRESKGLRQEDGAGEIGVAGSQLSAWEGDRYKSIGSLNLLKIATALKCSVDDLLVDVDPAYDAMRLDPACHADAGSSPSAPGEVDHAAASARLLADHRAHCAAISSELRAATANLGRIAAALADEADAPGTTQTKGARRRRRTS